MNETDIKIEAKELTDRQLYEMFIKMYNSDNNVKYELRPTKTLCHYDVLQYKTDYARSTTFTSLIEIKTREDYSYEQFDNTYFDKTKISYLLATQDDTSADDTYIVSFYPKSDKVVIHKLSDIDWENVKNTPNVNEVYVGTKNATWCTTYSRDIKKEKEVVYFPLHKQQDNNITYVFKFPDLQRTYDELYERNLEMVRNSVCVQTSS